MAGASSNHGNLYRDDEILVDRDGIPHFTGVMPGLMKEYRRRVLFAYTNLEGEGDDPEKERKDLEKKQRRFAKKLMDALHGEAWRACQDLLTDPKLKEIDGYKAIFEALASIEKAGVIRKTEAFDVFFDRTYRRRGESVDQYLRKRRESWADLVDLATGISMSDDLLAYFLLKNVNLSKEEKRNILLANQSDYTVTGIEKSLRITFFDVHEKEKGTRDEGGRGHPGDYRRGKGSGSKGYRRQYAHAAHEEDDYEEEEATDDDYPEETEEA